MREGWRRSPLLRSGRRPDGRSEDLANEALIGDASFGCRRLYGVEQCLGKRIFTRSVLGWNSTNTVRSCERSYSVKSALATNSSASSSVVEAAPAAGHC